MRGGLWRSRILSGEHQFPRCWTTNFSWWAVGTLHAASAISVWVFVHEFNRILCIISFLKSLELNWEVHGWFVTHLQWFTNVYCVYFSHFVSTRLREDVFSPRVSLLNWSYLNKILVDLLLFKKCDYFPQPDVFRLYMTSVTKPKMCVRSDHPNPQKLDLPCWNCRTNSPKLGSCMQVLQVSRENHMRSAFWRDCRSKLY